MSLAGVSYAYRPLYAMKRKIQIKLISPFAYPNVGKLVA